MIRCAAKYYPVSFIWTKTRIIIITVFLFIFFIHLCQPRIETSKKMTCSLTQWLKVHNLPVSILFGNGFTQWCAVTFFGGMRTTCLSPIMVGKHWARPHSVKTLMHYDLQTHNAQETMHFGGTIYCIWKRKLALTRRETILLGSCSMAEWQHFRMFLFPVCFPHWHACW